MRIIKSEWHQVEKRYAVDIDENLINEKGNSTGQFLEPKLR